MKEKIKNILATEADPSIRFEVLEKYYQVIDSEKDVKLLLNILEYDEDPCVRHEAAAQLFRVEEQKGHLMKKYKKHVIKKLADKAVNDPSTIVRHESIEALGYIGDKTILPLLKNLSSDSDLDIKSTAFIAYKTTIRRIDNKIKPRDLSNFLINQASE